MANFSGKQIPRDWLSLTGGVVQADQPKAESPRQAAMRRLRAKRAAAKAAGVAETDPHEEASQQEDQRPSKARKTLESYAPVPQAPPPPPAPFVPKNQSLVLASPPSPHSNHSVLAPPPPAPFVPKSQSSVPPPLSNQSVLAPPEPQPVVITTAVYRITRPPVTLQLFPQTPMYRRDIIGVRRAWVTRADGERPLFGWLRWSVTLDDAIIKCDCHNLIFRPDDFVKHAGLKCPCMDHRPLRHITMMRDPNNDHHV